MENEHLQQPNGQRAEHGGDAGNGGYGGSGDGSHGGNVGVGRAERRDGWDGPKALRYTAARVDPNAFTYEDAARLLDAITGQPWTGSREPPPGADDGEDDNGA